MEQSTGLRAPCRICGNWPCTCQRVFHCHDCDRLLDVNEASHDFVEDEEYVGAICLRCLNERLRVMVAWPRREIA